MIPNPATDFLDAVHQHITPLKGYQVKRVGDAPDLLRRSRDGIHRAPRA